MVCQLSFKIIREEALTYFTVHKLKLLLNMFNMDTWKDHLNDDITEDVIMERVGKIIDLLAALGRRYSD